jgi:hypothetical protein
VVSHWVPSNKKSHAFDDITTDAHDFRSQGDQENVTASAMPDCEEPGYPDPATGSGMHSTDPNRPLHGWLRDNVESARILLTKSEPIRYEVERMQVRGPMPLFFGQFRPWCKWK